MELRVGSGKSLPDHQLIMSDDGDIAELPADPETVTAYRAAHPSRPIAILPPPHPHNAQTTGTASRTRLADLPATLPAEALERAAECVRAGADLLVGDAYAEVAATTGAALAGTDEHAHLVIGKTLVDADDPAVAAVHAWRGAHVFRTHDPATLRQALDMVAAIKGDRPPAEARRGLA